MKRKALFVLGCVVGGVAVVAANVAVAQVAPVGLGTAASFAVLGGQTVTNTGPSLLNGDLGVSPGNTAPGFPPGIVNGAVHLGDAVALQAQTDLTTAYNDAANRPFTNVAVELGGTTLLPGVYRSPTLQITGTLTLNAQGNPNAVFIFQAGSTLITASNSRVLLINGAQPCNVYWQVGSSATLGVGTTFVGTVMALTSITANTGATVQGRLLARNGSTTWTPTRSQGHCPRRERSAAPTTPVPGGGIGPGGVSIALPGGSLPGGGVPGLNRGPDGDEDADQDADELPADSARRRQQREQDDDDADADVTPRAVPAASPAPTDCVRTGVCVPSRGRPRPPHLPLPRREEDLRTSRTPGRARQPTWHSQAWRSWWAGFCSSSASPAGQLASGADS